jgi:hypothetical protein
MEVLNLCLDIHRLNEGSISLYAIGLKEKDE